jgi:hypothetical protein
VAGDHRTHYRGADHRTDYRRATPTTATVGGRLTGDSKCTNEQGYLGDFTHHGYSSVPTPALGLP